MQPIFIDITRFLYPDKKTAGIDRVAIAYIKHYQDNAYAAVSIGSRLFVISLLYSKEIFKLLVSPTKYSLIKIWFLTIQGIINNKHSKVETNNHFFLNLTYANVRSTSYHAQIKRLGLLSVFMVHDLFGSTHPEYFPAQTRIKHLARMKHILANAHGVITNSATTFNQLTKHIQSNDYRTPAITTALLAPGFSTASSFSKPPIASPYFVMLGKIAAHKNHFLIVQLWRKLVELLGNNAPKLIIIGHSGWQSKNVLDFINRSETLRNFVFKCTATDNEIISYLHHAQALLFPTFTEGFGIPLVEALNLGVPAIVSDISVFHEIGGDIPEYIDPIDGKGWMEMILAYTDSNHPRRIAQLQRITHFKTPTWAAHFEKINKFLNNLRTSSAPEEQIIATELPNNLLE